MRYTEQGILKLKLPDGKKEQKLCIDNNLYLRIRPSSKTWLFRRQNNGKQTFETIGKFPDITMKQAKAEAATRKISDPVSTTTVNDVISQYMKIVERTHKRPDFVRRYFERAVIPTIGNRKISEIKRAELVKLIQDFKVTASDYGRGDGSRSADQLRSNLKKLFEYAVELGLVESNPLLGVSRRISDYIPKSRERTLSPDEIKSMWNWKNADKGWQKTEQNLKVAKFLLLTSLRISEAQKGYQDGDFWIVPEQISKNGKAHWIYLTETAKEQLPLPKCTATNIQAWLRRKLDTEGMERFTPHDLRRSAATLMADNGVDPFIVERMLNHTLEGVMAVYNRAEYREERIHAAKALERVVLNITK